MKPGSGLKDVEPLLRIPNFLIDLSLSSSMLPLIFLTVLAVPSEGSKKHLILVKWLWGRPR